MDQHQETLASASNAPSAPAVWFELLDAGSPKFLAFAGDVPGLCATMDPGEDWFAWLRRHMSDDHFACLLTALDRARSERRCWTHVFPLALTHGERWIQLAARVSEATEGVVHHGVLVDVTERHAQEELALRHAISVAGTHGEQFFSSLVEHLSSILRPDIAFVGKLDFPGSRRVGTVAVAVDGKLAAPLEYELEGTPCAKVLDSGACAYPAGVQKAFPADTLLTQLAIEGYVGQPLVGSDGTALGLIVLLYKRPLTEPARARALMEIFAARAASELERHTAERELRHREALLHGVVDNTPALIYVKDLENRLILVNRPFQHIFGMKLEDMLGKTSAELFPREMAEGYKRNDQLVIETGKPLQMEEWVAHADGPHPYLSLKFPLHDAQGRVCAVAGISTDMRERKLNAQALAAERNFNAAVLDTVGALIVVLDRDGRIVRFNKACEACTGYTSDEVLGRPFMEIFLEPHEVSAVAAVFRQLTAGDFPIAHENLWRTKGGARRRISWSNTALCDQAGLVTHVIGTGIDVTDKRELEARLLQAQKLESLGRLAGGVAHDFNNLLSPVLMCSEQLRAAELAPPQRDAVLAICDAAERARNLTAQLLAFGRGQSLSLRVVNLHDYVRGLHKLLQHLVRENVELVIRCDAENPQVLADESQLGQLVMNLVLNASDAMPKGGQILLALSNASDDAALTIGSSSGFWVRLSISDTGVGISEETRARVFEPFFTTKGPGHGTGLGLATVHRIVQQHEGFVRVESELGRGTTFEVFLPATTGHNVRNTASELRTAPRRSDGLACDGS